MVILEFLKSRFGKKGLTAMEFMIYVVIIVVFLAVMLYIASRMGKGGGGMVKFIRDIFKFGN